MVSALNYYYKLFMDFERHGFDVENEIHMFLPRIQADTQRLV